MNCDSNARMEDFKQSVAVQEIRDYEDWEGIRQK